MVRKALIYEISTLLTMVGVGATTAGIGFILQPDGTGVGVPLNLLKDSPFENYLIPGIILLTVNGICSLIGAILVFKEYHYAPIVVSLLGTALLIWMLAQIYWIGMQSWLQPSFLVVGAVELFLGFSLFRQQQGNHGMLGGHKGTQAH